MCNLWRILNEYLYLKSLDSLHNVVKDLLFIVPVAIRDLLSVMYNEMTVLYVHINM